MLHLKKNSTYSTCLNVIIDSDSCVSSAITSTLQLILLGLEELSIKDSKRRGQYFGKSHKTVLEHTFIFKGDFLCGYLSDQ